MRQKLQGDSTGESHQESKQETNHQRSNLGSQDGGDKQSSTALSALAMDEMQTQRSLVN